jgi:alginate O-acetyltransferase complex protein AlgI
METIKNILSYSEDTPLLFTQMYFWIFFFIVFSGFAFIYNKKLFRSTYLFALSLFFYWKSGGHFFVLLLFTTLLDYSIGNIVYKTVSKKQKKAWVAVSLVLNLGILFYFKYTGFFVDIFNSIFNTQYELVNILAKWSNNSLGTSFDITKILLPVGISFYTFQSLSYVLDISKGKLKPVNNILEYGFYVTFFPQLVAGPIVRASQFIPQLYKNYQLTKEEANFALFLILNGLMKKMIISDYISYNFVERVFDSPLSFTGFENLMAVYGFGIQIYCDFSGYTDVAIGIALLLGFRLPLNFNSPYKAENITDFWKRWHISLTTWFRDYVFLPIAFRVSGGMKAQKYLGIKAEYYIYLIAGIITFVLTGLWHGAAWRFLIWGGLHGLALVLHRFWTGYVSKRMRKKYFPHFLSVFLTFNLVSFAWIFFRAKDMSVVSQMLHQVFDSFSWALIPDILVSYWQVFALILAAYIIHWLPKSFKHKYIHWFKKTPVWVKLCIVILVVFICYQAKSADVQPFIYFQF